MGNHYSRDGRRISEARWRLLAGDVRYRTLAQTTLARGGWVSTLWLGVDDAAPHDGPPLIFETVAFAHERLRHRYATEDEALAGHRELVERLGGPADPTREPRPLHDASARRLRQSKRTSASAGEADDLEP